MKLRIKLKILPPPVNSFNWLTTILTYTLLNKQNRRLKIFINKADALKQ